MSNFFSGDFFGAAYAVRMAKSGGMRVLSFLDKPGVAPYITLIKTGLILVNAAHSGMFSALPE